jgi:tetratricopeptide (TPR) repeat protein
LFVGQAGAIVGRPVEKVWDRKITLTTPLVDTVTMLLKVVRSGKSQPSKLVTHRFALDAVMKPYDTSAYTKKCRSEQLERHPVTEVTTPSLDAFQMYARGADLHRRGFAADAIPFFQRATELDPDFATAFHLLGNAYETTGPETLAIACSKQAFARRDRVSERERLAITAVYHMRVTGDAAKALDAVNQFVNAYPRAPTPRAYRGTFEVSIGQSKTPLVSSRSSSGWIRGARSD